MQSAPFMVATGTLQGRSRSFSNLDQKVDVSFLDCDMKSCMLKKYFTVSRTVELSSEGVSKLVLKLESIGGIAKIALTSMFAKLQKLGTDWHALCYCVRLLLACLASYSGFLAIAFAACGTKTLVCATDSKRWGEKTWI